MINKKIKVKFTQSFTSAELGNVYEGMVRTLPKRVLNKYLDSKVCEIVEDEKPVKEEVKDDAIDKPKRSKKPSKSRRKRG